MKNGSALPFRHNAPASWHEIHKTHIFCMILRQVSDQTQTINTMQTLLFANAVTAEFCIFKIHRDIYTVPNRMSTDRIQQKPNQTICYESKLSAVCF